MLLLSVFNTIKSVNIYYTLIILRKKYHNFLSKGCKNISGFLSLIFRFVLTVLKAEKGGKRNP